MSALIKPEMNDIPTIPDMVLGKLPSTLGNAKTTEELARPLLTLLELVTGLESVYLTRVDLKSNVQKVLFSRNSKTMQIPEGLTVPWEDTLCKRALDQGMLYAADVMTCWADSKKATSLGIRTYITTPLYREDGELYGTLCGASMSQQSVSEEAQKVLRLFGILIEQHIQREQLVKRLRAANRQLEAQSYSDSLTGLPNRRFIMRELDRFFAFAKREKRIVYLAFIDLDSFKKINDMYGHEAGDNFLIEVSKRLSSGVRGSDFIGRLGGDEFIFVALGTPNDTNHEVTIEALHKRLTPLAQGAFNLGEIIIDYSGASFGIIHADPSEITPKEALSQADRTMYLAKNARKDTSPSNT